MLPLVVSSDSGGYVHVWAVRGSLYSDRLMLGLCNTGRASGPSAPSLKVVDLTLLKVHARDTDAMIAAFVAAHEAGATVLRPPGGPRQPARND